MSYWAPIDEEDDVDPRFCMHDFDRIRKFDGSLLCENCYLVIGNWRTA